MSINLAKPFGIRAVLRGRYARSDFSNLPRRLWRVAAKALWAAAVLSCVAVLSPAQPTIKINEYQLPQLNSNPWSLTAGPDGAIWYTLAYGDLDCTSSVHDAIGRITPEGIITEYPLPDPPCGHGPHGITAGPDGALWFTELRVNKIGRITTAGVVTEYPLSTPNAGPYEITAGPDDALWFTELGAGKIGRITTTGVVTEYPAEGVSDPTDIVAGPDGALWFTNLNSSWIGRMSTQGDVTKYPIPVFSHSHGIAAGPDNALWFTGGSTGTGAVIWRITTNGIFSMYSVPTKDAGPIYITLGPDGALWFTEQNSRQIGRVTTEGVFTEYSAGTSGGFPVAITTGPDGAVWFGKLDYIDQIILLDSAPPVITVLPTHRILWPPDGRMVTVTVSGTITDNGSGVLASSAEYTVADEYRMIQPRGDITLDTAGNYSFALSLRASRQGTDENGRHYQIRVSARDNAGNRSAKWSVVEVPHDRRY